MQPIVEAARARYLVPLWSPAIIAEANRLLTWLWLEKNGGDLSESSWNRCSDLAHRWFRHMTAAFRVVDDHPPYAGLWADPPPDEWDVPIWTAAVRGRAHFIVTADRRQMPPRDADGMRTYRDVIFAEPDAFGAFLDAWSVVIDSGGAPGIGATDEHEDALQARLLEIFRQVSGEPSR